MRPDLVTRYRRNRGRGFIARNSLEHWRDLLEAWCQIHEEYCQRVRGDAIYWNIERSNVGALANAASRVNWPVLEEFSQSKRQGRTRFAGRADLYFKSPCRDEYVESKLVWIPLHRGTPAWPQRIAMTLQKACKEASELHLTLRTETAVGVAFAVPYYPERSTGTVALEPLFDALSSSSYDAIAWCFPDCARVLSWNDPPPTIYPGVILLARSAETKR